MLHAVPSELLRAERAKELQCCPRVTRAFTTADFSTGEAEGSLKCMRPRFTGRSRTDVLYAHTGRPNNYQFHRADDVTIFSRAGLRLSVSLSLYHAVRSFSRLLRSIEPVILSCSPAIDKCDRCFSRDSNAN